MRLLPSKWKTPASKIVLNILVRGTEISFKIAIKSLADKPSVPTDFFGSNSMTEDGIELMRLKNQKRKRLINFEENGVEQQSLQHPCDQS